MRSSDEKRNHVNVTIMIVIVKSRVEGSQEADELKQIVLKRIHNFLDYL